VQRRNYQGFGAANAAVRLAAQTRESRRLTIPRAWSGTCVIACGCCCRSQKAEISRKGKLSNDCLWPPSGHSVKSVTQLIAMTRWRSSRPFLIGQPWRLKPRTRWQILPLQTLSACRSIGRLPPHWNR